MKPKCNRYEQLFIFGDNEKLLSHLQECEECKNEHAKMQQIQNLVKEVKPHLKKKNNLNLTKIAAGLTTIVLVYFSISYNFLADNTYNDYLSENPSIIQEMGLPTDEYGLLMVD